MKRKKIILAMAALSAAVSLAACQQAAVEKDELEEISKTEGCGCIGCPYCGSNAAGNEAPGEESSGEPEAVNQEETTHEETVLAETAPEENTADDGGNAEAGEDGMTAIAVPETEAVDIKSLTEGEKAARREQQANFNEARLLLYTLDNSKDKTEKIFQMDEQILNNNSYDFSGKNIVFIGDSITEGIKGAIDQNGNFVSYVTYANSYLHFQNVINNGKGGRMFSSYGGDELSIAMEFGNVTYIDSDIIVVFAGVNDYLSIVPQKRFGDIYNKESTAGFCGAVRYFMKQLAMYYADNDIFFVTMYDVQKTADCSYSDYEGSLSLGDYMAAERSLAKEYGFNIIDLYGTGFMDCSSQESADYYLRDGLHPKDNGNIALGVHIAAELSLYFSQKE